MSRLFVGDQVERRAVQGDHEPADVPQTLEGDRHGGHECRQDEQDHGHEQHRRLEVAVVGHTGAVGGDPGGHHNDYRSDEAVREFASVREIQCIVEARVKWSSEVECADGGHAERREDEHGREHAVDQVDTVLTADRAGDVRVWEAACHTLERSPSKVIRKLSPIRRSYGSQLNSLQILSQD